MPNLTNFTGGVPAITPIGGDLTNIDGILQQTEDNMPTLSIRGATFRLFVNNEEMVIRGSDNMPAKMLDIVMLRAGDSIHRAYYAEQFVEGKRMRPTCSSTDGIRPDAGVAAPQSDLCASCPHMKFDQPTAKGGHTKRCGDSRLLAFSAVGDLGNQAFGMPCTIRLSYRNMQAMRAYAEFLRDHMNIRAYNHLVTRLSFDPAASYPLLQFEPIRALSQAEYDEFSKYYDPKQEEAVLYKVLREIPPSQRQTAQPATPAQAPAPTPAPAPTQAASPVPPNAPQGTPWDAQPAAQPAPAPAATAAPATPQGVPWGSAPAAQPAPAVQPAAPAAPAPAQAPSNVVTMAPVEQAPAPAKAVPEPAPAAAAPAPAASATPDLPANLQGGQIEPGTPEVTAATTAVNDKLTAFLSGNV